MERGLFRFLVTKMDNIDWVSSKNGPGLWVKGHQDLY